MKPVIISREEARKSGEAAGFSPLPKDHPLRSEGPSIQFLSHTQKQSGQKDADSRQDDWQKDLATQNKKKDTF